MTRANLAELVRFYQAGALNAAFGFGTYAALLALGADRYLAQALAHAAGTAFNYFSYRRHVFRGAAPARTRFLAAYAGNYLVGLGFLAAFAQAVASPYLAGLLALVATSLVNYGALKHFVFARPGTG